MNNVFLLIRMTQIRGTVFVWRIHFSGVEYLNGIISTVKNP